MGEIHSHLVKAAKRILSGRLTSCLTQLRRLQPDQRSLYMRRVLLQALGLRSWPRTVPPTARSLLFVCHGNIMRSPMCERLLGKRLAEAHLSGHTVASAGLHAQSGTPADPRARTAAQEYGVNLDAHRAQILSDDLVRKADVVLAMDLLNYVELLSRYPSADSKIGMLASYSSTTRSEIPDPYLGTEDDVRACYSVLNHCIANLVKELSAAHPCVEAPTAAIGTQSR